MDFGMDKRVERGFLPGTILYADIALLKRCTKKD